MAQNESERRESEWESASMERERSKVAEKNDRVSAYGVRGMCERHEMKCPGVRVRG